MAFFSFFLPLPVSRDSDIRDAPREQAKENAIYDSFTNYFLPYVLDRKRQPFSEENPTICAAVKFLYCNPESYFFPPLVVLNPPPKAFKIALPAGNCGDLHFLRGERYAVEMSRDWSSDSPGDRLTLSHSKSKKSKHFAKNREGLGGLGGLGASALEVTQN
jgi:hypothetical protein